MKMQLHAQVYEGLQFYIVREIDRYTERILYPK